MYTKCKVCPWASKECYLQLQPRLKEGKHNHPEGKLQCLPLGATTVKQNWLGSANWFPYLCWSRALQYRGFQPRLPESRWGGVLCSEYGEHKPPFTLSSLGICCHCWALHGLESGAKSFPGRAVLMQHHQSSGWDVSGKRASWQAGGACVGQQIVVFACQICRCSIERNEAPKTCTKGKELKQERGGM